MQQSLNPLRVRKCCIGTPSPVCVCTLCEALSHGSSLGQSTLTDVYSCATPCMRQQLRLPFRWPQLKSFRWPQLQCAGQTCVFSKTMYLDRQRYTVFWPYTICRPNTKTKISRTTTHTHRHRRSVFFFLHAAIRNSLRSNKSVPVARGNVVSNKQEDWSTPLLGQASTIQSVRGVVDQYRGRISYHLQHISLP